MHEMGIAQQMVDIALDAIPAEIENPRVEKLNLKIGRLASVVEESLRFCMEVITKNTPLEGVKLEIEAVDVRARCKACNHEWVVEGPGFRCPACRQGDVELLSGRELEISSLELADE
ncbi:MAG: hydrogenase maturation nickel metallochaperone HypA [Desulfobacterium sp.]|jgi:hydrogenase nickel incorporation protein HypA/HybF|nr:hydrogenase maturation nickel metallochaperone HypA [Desulfobacterium sp.]